MSYNGWSNRETWLINVWFNPESPEDVDSIESQVMDDYEQLPDYIKDFVDIGQINWQELKDAVAEPEDEGEESEND